MNQIQVRQRGLDHDNIRALPHVERTLAHGFAGVMPIHLVAFPVAKRRRGACRVPERPVKGRSELRGICHNRDITESIPVKHPADGSNAPVHHIAGGDHVRARPRVAERNPCQAFQGAVVVHLVPAQDTAVAMGGILAHAHIGNDIKPGHQIPQAADALLHNAVLRPCGGAFGILVRGQAEQHHAGNPVRAQALHQARQLVGRIMVLSRQGRDFAVNMLPLRDKRRIDKAVRGYAGFPHHAA